MNTSRHEYDLGEIDESGLLADPIAQLNAWLTDARESGHPEPTAMCLSTVDADGRPSARMVLLRGLDAQGLTFFTNYDSRKGQALDAHPYAAVTFWWANQERQVRIEGPVEKVPPAVSDAYFDSRPLESRYASAASPQSQPVESRQVLEDLVAKFHEQHPENPPRPAHWGGYLLRPERIEFWQGRPARLHDRILFEKAGADWKTTRLAP